MNNVKNNEGSVSRYSSFVLISKLKASVRKARHIAMEQAFYIVTNATLRVTPWLAQAC
jgi:hypothetical protein